MLCALLLSNQPSGHLVATQAEELPKSIWMWLVLFAIGVLLPVGMVFLVGVGRAIAHEEKHPWHLGIDFGVTLMAAASAFALDLGKRILGDRIPGKEGVFYFFIVVAFIAIGVSIVLGTMFSEKVLE